ncbi:tyrosyl-tRNA synthetase [Rhizina undulata]
MFFLRLARTAVYRRPSLLRSFSNAIHNDTRSIQSGSLLKHLEERGLAESVTGPTGALDKFVSENSIVAYAGVDPTASSLHVGHLLPLMNLLHFYLNGHRSIALIGKATASVGDPSGRATERDSIEARRLKNSFDSLWKQIDGFFESGEKYAVARGYAKGGFGRRELVTNGEWLGDLGLVEFLNVVGRHVRVSQMLARDSVKGRMESGQGINFSEFTYQLLQSYDFWHLYHSKNCRLQIGGNDQFGNITAGIDLISKLAKPAAPSAQEIAYGLTVPLLTTSSGAKFGKSAGNAVWLDENLTSPFELYQYFVRLPDEVMERYLKMFTLLPLPIISEVVAAHSSAPEKRGAQHLLAKEVVALIHGAEKAQRAENQTRVLFPFDGERVFSAEEVVEEFKGDKRMVEVPREELVGELLVKILRRVGAVGSRSEAENVVRQGGVYVGIENRRVLDAREVVEESMLVEGTVLLARVGKGKVVVVRGVKKI